jgi:hypothetical protein
MLDFTSVDRVLAKLYRELKTDFNDNDVIEWIGEALDFLKVHAVTEQAVAFIEVNNYECELPNGFLTVLQIARNQNWSKENDQCLCPCTVTTEVVQDGNTTTTTTVEVGSGCTTCDQDCPKPNMPVPLNCQGEPMTDYDLAYYRPYFDLQWAYNGWVNSEYYFNNYTPVRLADNTFFKSIVCKEQNHDAIYHSCRDEYTIVGHGQDRKLRFSFKEGSIALAFEKSVIDRDTGYPMIPDQISFITAITYYVQWKIAAQLDWEGREGFARKAENAERRWLKYARQAKNWAKMPKTLDDYQDLLEQSHYLIPNHKRFYGFFGNLNQPENRSFNNPDRYNHFSKRY